MPVGKPIRPATPRVWLRPVLSVIIWMGMRLPLRASGTRLRRVLRMFGIQVHSAPYRRAPPRSTNTNEIQSRQHNNLPRSGLAEPFHRGSRFRAALACGAQCQTFGGRRAAAMGGRNRVRDRRGLSGDQCRVPALPLAAPVAGHTNPSPEACLSSAKLAAAAFGWHPNFRLFGAATSVLHLIKANYDDPTRGKFRRLAGFAIYLAHTYYGIPWNYCTRVHRIRLASEFHRAQEESALRRTIAGRAPRLFSDGLYRWFHRRIAQGGRNAGGRTIPFHDCDAGPGISGS